MSYSIYWTPESRQTFDQNLEFLEQEWNNAVINEFLDRVETVLETIKKNPYIYPVLRVSPEVRKCIINQRIILYFCIIDDHTIDLQTFWNTHQDPDSLKAI